MDKIAIEFQGVTKTFREGKDLVLDSIDLKIPEGKLTFVMGPSGTGKSVMIKHILGLMRPDSGKILIRGKDLGTLTIEELKTERSHFGMLFQGSALFTDMTVYENVAFPLREHTEMTEDEIEAKVNSTLRLLEMKDGYDKFPSELSGGMQKRVGLARAIIREPDFLLYDEPTTGLDPVTRTTVDDLIATLKAKLKLTSIVVSHDIPAGLLLADLIIFLFEGKPVFVGTAAEFKKSNVPAIQRFLAAEQRVVEALK